MGYHLSIEIGKMKFRTMLKRRIVVVDDDSGSCKTRLYEAVHRYPGNRAKIMADLPVKVVDDVDDLNKIKEKSIVLIDEDCACLRREQVEYFVEKIKNTDHWYVIITRENSLSRLPYGIDDIVIMRPENGVLTLVNKYDTFYKHNSGNVIKHVQTEDETTGLLFFKKICKDTTTFRGKDNWNVAMNALDSDGLLVFDRCGFGSCAKDFYNKWIFKKQVQILDYSSFEGMLLELMKKTVDISEVYNVEESYTKAVCEILLQYGKTLNCPCLKFCKCNDCKYELQFTDSEQCFRKTEYNNYVNWR